MAAPESEVLALPFKDSIRRPDRDNTIDVYISDDYEDVLADGVWENFFTEKPEPLTREEKKAWVAQLKDVALGSDAFFPFGDNIERAHRSGVQYIAQAGALSVMIMLSKPAISTVLQWHSPACVCSTTKIAL